ncbi:excalibur calcium-binding domain-containing protein [Streptomyces sp. NPDC048416]|uniref:excalibur calcium-binding domain-containing protein n=1 Tax=Streptomyces sp. NPDC048416 TaxID=3365546 RepID=UPI003721C953
MRISSPAVRTLLVFGLLGALALTTTGCQDSTPRTKKPMASVSPGTPSASPSPSPSDSATPTASATPTPSPARTHPATPAAPPASKPPAVTIQPKPKPKGPSLPPPMNGGGNKVSGGGGGGSSASYQNCAAARAAGVTPLHRGDPGYAAHLDRDGDGVACE